MTPMSEPVRSLHVWINGEARTVPAPATIADLVAELGLQPGQVAVERNKVLVRRAEHPTTALVDGDRLEIVTLFGGG